MKPTEEKIIIGLMTGTSADSLDCAAVSFRDDEMKVIGLSNYALPKRIQNEIFVLSNSNLIDQSKLKVIDEKLGKFFLEKTRHFLKTQSIEPNEVYAIGSHGQTIKHEPNSSTPISIQIGDPQIISDDLEIITVANFRQDDLEAGGQGAPLSPLFHREMFFSEVEERVIINIGGITNVSFLSKEKLLGFDTGPGNCLMDFWSRKNQIGPFDNNGSWAKSGNINEQLLEIMISDDFFSKLPPKSTGPDYFGSKWLERYLNSFKKNLSPEDVQCTLAELTALSLANSLSSVKNTHNHLYLCGGGAQNSFLMERIENLSSTKCFTTSDLGVDPDFLEAICFAWLAKQRLENRKFRMTEITGSKKEVFLGRVYYPSK